MVPVRGLSALVYLKNPEDREIYEKTYSLLKFMAEEGIYGISQVFTTAEADEKYHLDYRSPLYWNRMTIPRSAIRFIGRL